MRFPVCWKENFAGLKTHRKRGRSARASPTSHHTLHEERTARFTAQPLSALVQISLCLVFNTEFYAEYLASVANQIARIFPVMHTRDQQNIEQ